MNLKSLVAAALLAVASLCPVAQAQQEGKPDILEVLEVSGEINDFTPGRIKDQVEKYNDNPKVKAVLLILDTPGGGARASAAARDSLSKIKVPVVVWCKSVCASGGIMMMTAPSIKYLALPNEGIAGSVGVIASVTRYHRLLDWAKIDSEIYKSGSLKDAMNPTRPANEEEKKYVQGIVDDLAQSFYKMVADSRGTKISEAAWVEIKKAKIFFGPQAVKMGLVDAVMTEDQARMKAKELSGSKLIYTRVELKKMSTVADETYRNTAPLMPFQATAPDRAVDSLNQVLEAVQEVRSGETVKFEYRMPYKF